MNKYSTMQKNQYDYEASNWSLGNIDWVVGSFRAHNEWPDYDLYLFKDKVCEGKIALDFGCGPGRNIVKFSGKFARIDGVDISSLNLSNAEIWCKENKIPVMPILYHNNGKDLSCIPTNDYYDIIFSTIVMQHICVHEIRLGLWKEFFRLLKPGGSICMQMGYGKRPGSVDYYANNYDAHGTNGMCDTRIENVSQIRSDLEGIGFQAFDYDIRPTGPGDAHDNWIYFRAIK